MTDMTDAQISRALALAIGYREETIWTRALDGAVMVPYSGGWSKAFDYRDPTVIWRVAERFDCFPQKLRLSLGDKWGAGTFSPEFGWVSQAADTAAKAVALAVISAHGG